MGRLRLLTHNGETRSIKEWATHLGVSTALIHNRLSRGHALADVLKPKHVKQPKPRPEMKPPRQYQYGFRIRTGEKKSISELQAQALARDPKPVTLAMRAPEPLWWQCWLEACAKAEQDDQALPGADSDFQETRRDRLTSTARDRTETGFLQGNDYPVIEQEHAA